MAVPAALQLCLHSKSSLRPAAQRPLQQLGGRPNAARAPCRPLHCAAQARPFGAGDAGRQPQPPAALARQAPAATAADTAVPASATIQPALPVAEQARQLRALVQHLAGAASYGCKVRGGTGLRWPPGRLAGVLVIRVCGTGKLQCTHWEIKLCTPCPPPPACSWRSCWPSRRCRPSLRAHGARLTLNSSLLLARRPAGFFLHGCKASFVLNCQPAILLACREGRLAAGELQDLPAREAYCLALLPAILQQHVLSLMPTGLPLSSALGQLAAGGCWGWQGGWAFGVGSSSSAATDCTRGTHTYLSGVDCNHLQPSASQIPCSPAHRCRAGACRGVLR
jgi:hypothetical protein